MTTIETTFNSQTQLERRVVPPSYADTGYEQEETSTFPPNVIPSENSIETTQDPYTTQVEAFFDQDKAAFQGLLELRLRGEVVAQLFKKHPKEVARGSVNLAEVEQVLRTHIAQAKESNSHLVNYIDNVTIPKARTRFEAPVDPIPGDIHYLNKDVPQLEAREDSYAAMVDYLDEFEPKSEDAYRELTEEYVKRILPDARQEAIDILQQKIDERETQKREAEREIERLEQTIDTLLAERDEARAEVVQRDLEMLDGEMDAHLEEVSRLTEDAKRLAA